MKNKIKKIEKEALFSFSHVKSIKDLENLYLTYLGRKRGKLKIILRQLPTLPLQQRKEIGILANKVKKELETVYRRTKEEFLKKTRKERFFDVTLPGKKLEYSNLHPITQVRQEVEECLKSMGFEIVEGSELESDYYNFESLNIPKDHPARDIQDTFFVKGEKDLVMRTHTTNMLVRIMERRKPPMRIAVFGRCFRREATDPRHEHTFYQLDGFLVGERISLANLIWLFDKFFQSIFRKKIKFRLRPGYFPFVEPGLELDLVCFKCQGRGCFFCKNTGWLEMLGCGMIHPKVFEAAGYSKGKYTGFAFGMGFDRLVMLKYGIDDIRLFHSGDLRFLKQF